MVSTFPSNSLSIVYALKDITCVHTKIPSVYVPKLVYWSTQSHPSIISRTASLRSVWSSGIALLADRTRGQNPQWSSCIRVKCTVVCRPTTFYGIKLFSSQRNLPLASDTSPSPGTLPGHCWDLSIWHSVTDSKHSTWSIGTLANAHKCSTHLRHKHDVVQLYRVQIIRAFSRRAYPSAASPDQRPERMYQNSLQKTSSLPKAVLLFRCNEIHDMPKRRSSFLCNSLAD